MITSPARQVKLMSLAIKCLPTRTSADRSSTTVSRSPRRWCPITSATLSKPQDLSVASLPGLAHTGGAGLLHSSGWPVHGTSNAYAVGSSGVAIETMSSSGSTLDVGKRMVVVAGSQKFNWGASDHSCQGDLGIDGVGLVQVMSNPDVGFDVDRHPVVGDALQGNERPGHVNRAAAPQLEAGP